MFNNEGDTSANAVGQDAEDQKTAAAATLDVAALATERDQLAAEKADLQDRLLRRAAEFENFRRRAEREKAELGEFATMETLRRVLPFLDDFERAIQTETSDKDYSKGMELILQRLTAELQKMGLEPIPAVGQQFDPHLHHALEMQPSSDAEENSILAEYQKGYMFRGKLLRPALVRVAVAPPALKQAES